jgi:hypothetical protein
MLLSAASKRSCIRCRGKKIKCDGIPCSNCQKEGLPLHKCHRCPVIQTPHSSLMPIRAKHLLHEKNTRLREVTCKRGDWICFVSDGIVPSRVVNGCTFSFLTPNDNTKLQYLDTGNIPVGTYVIDAITLHVTGEMQYGRIIHGVEHGQNNSTNIICQKGDVVRLISSGGALQTRYIGGATFVFFGDAEKRVHILLTKEIPLGIYYLDDVTLTIMEPINVEPMQLSQPLSSEESLEDWMVNPESSFSESQKDS